MLYFSEELVDGLRQNNINKYSHLLTGYIGSRSFLLKVADVVRELKQVNPHLIYGACRRRSQYFCTGSHQVSRLSEALWLLFGRHFRLVSVSWSTSPKCAQVITPLSQIEFHVALAGL